MSKLAIIGASTGQLQLCKKARLIEDLETYCFAWNKGAVCENLVDHFVPISILEKDKIVDYCSNLSVDGVVSNGSELTASISNYVAEKLHLPCTPYNTILNIQDKSYVRNLSSSIEGLRNVSNLQIHASQLKDISDFPCVIKPIRGSGKKGVNFLKSKSELDNLLIPQDLENVDFLVESYIGGREVSVESLSFHGEHHVIQITDKITSGPPHFVELSHLQPSSISSLLIEKIKLIIPNLLNRLNFYNGATHTELKIDKNGNIFLIEVNPRGGGDLISDFLIEMSTNIDYVSDIIRIALNRYQYVTPKNISNVGVTFLCKQNDKWFHYIKEGVNNYDFIQKSYYDGEPLREATSNYDRNGFILFKNTLN